ncbi:hypothetical protein [Methylobacterium sp. B1]|uniref:hypothetical protein n=1 Tax=Methylobacterium sp. B1 TaxID=91459 RepID=UPI0011D22FF3|nr:hypothetical protein [Methylobacterium sp. B1]
MAVPPESTAGPPSGNRLAHGIGQRREGEAIAVQLDHRMTVVDRGTPRHDRPARPRAGARLRRATDGFRVVDEETPPLSDTEFDPCEIRHFALQHSPISVMI